MVALLIFLAKTLGCRPSDGYFQAIPPKAKLCGISYSIRIPCALSAKAERRESVTNHLNEYKSRVKSFK